jgi:hypothetical protein
MTVADHAELASNTLDDASALHGSIPGWVERIQPLGLMQI